MVEQWTFNPLVVGSNPTQPTKKSLIIILMNTRLFMKNKYLIIGSGRTARHIIKYFFLLKNIDFICWDRKSKDKFNDIVNISTHILVLIQDDIIENFIKNNINNYKNKIIIHFSGSLYSEIAIGIHPLMTFNKNNYYSLKDYQNICFTIDRKISFNKIFPFLQNKCFFISKKNKGLYHAMCVMSSNFPMILWKKSIDIFVEKFNIPASSLFPLIYRSLKNIFLNKKNALTGPFFRKDIRTINNHVDSLKHDDYLEIYKAFYKVVLKNEKQKK